MAKDKKKKSKNQGNAGDVKKEPGFYSFGEMAGKNKLNLSKLKKTVVTKAFKSNKLPVVASVPLKASVGPQQPEFEWKFVVISCVAVMLIAFAIHLVTVNSGFVLNDKYSLIYVLNPQVMQSVSEQIMKDLFSKPLTQPWLKASFIADRGDYGSNFMWYHAVNVFLHAAATGYFFAFVIRLCRALQLQGRLKVNPYYLSFAAAAIFACHPFTSETVAYLSARSALLGTTNYLLSINLFLLAYLSAKIPVRITGYILSLFVGAMALWSNPENVSLPAVILMIAFFIQGPLSKWRDTVAQHPFVIRLLFLLTLSVPFLAMTGVEYIRAIRLFSLPLSSLSYVASFLKALPLYYMRCFLVPLGLSVDPPFATAASFTDPLAILGVLSVAAFVYVLYRFRRYSLPCFAGVLLLVGFIPHLIMVQSDVVADWVAYLPLTGFAMLFGWGIALLAEQSFKKALILLVSVILIFSGLTVWRDTQWSSDLSLWQSAATVRPKSALAHAMLSTQWLLRHKIDTAASEAKQALVLSPSSAIAHLAEGQVLIAQKNFDEATKSFRWVEELAKQKKCPRKILEDAQLGEIECLIHQGEIQKADSLLLKSARELPGDARIIYLAGLESVAKKDYMQALKFLTFALKQDPSLVGCWEPVLLSSMELKMYDTAYLAAANLKANYDSAYSRWWLARTAIATGKELEGEEILNALVKENPRDARALYLLAKLHKRKNQSQDAERYEKEALLLEPNIGTELPLSEFDSASAEAGSSSEEQGK